MSMKEQRDRISAKLDRVGARLIDLQIAQRRRPRINALVEASGMEVKKPDVQPQIDQLEKEYADLARELAVLGM